MKYLEKEYQIGCQDLFKYIGMTMLGTHQTSLIFKYLLKTEDVFSVAIFHLWRHLQDIFKNSSCKHVLKTSWKIEKCYTSTRIRQDKCLLGSSTRIHQDKCLLGSNHLKRWMFQGRVDISSAVLLFRPKNFTYQCRCRELPFYL